MHQKLAYLVQEIAAGLEIYFSGASGANYLKTAFILCDDYTELASKLFLLIDSPAWSDAHPNGRFKTYHQVSQEVEGVFAIKRAGDLGAIQSVGARLRDRRIRRNSFFHSATLLDVNLYDHDIIRAFTDLLDYCALLFQQQWVVAAESWAIFATLEALVRCKRKALEQPAFADDIRRIFRDWPRNRNAIRTRGAHVAEYPEDLHLRLCLIYGGPEIRDKLRSLL